MQLWPQCIHDTEQILFAGHLVGSVNFIWLAAVLHVLSEADCKKFLANAKLLLKRGGAVYGWTAGSTQPKEWADTPDGRQKRFLHSPVSLLLCSYSKMCLQVRCMAATICSAAVASPIIQRSVTCIVCM